MSSAPRHFKDELQDWLDGRLDADTCAEAERHVETCAECRRDYEAMWWTKKMAKAHGATVELPAGLQARILNSIRLSETQAPAAANAPVDSAPLLRPPFWRRQLRPILAAAAILMMTAGLAFYFSTSHRALPAILAEDYRAYRARSLALDLLTSDVTAMTTYFKAEGVNFNTRVFDLAMMRYTLVGGRVQRQTGEPRALFVYRGSANQEIACQMYLGRVADLPAGATVRENNGLRFHVYQARGLTAVFWQEGAVVCALTSDIPAEEVIQLAFAKAMP